jgi:predicted phage terminase large subunit-like protein
MTRWHDDDLAGRLLAQEAEKWTVISIPAIREDMSLPEDPRQTGEALWESKHSLERMHEAEKRSPRQFAAMYQQRPSIEGGNIVKYEWFNIIPPADFAKMRKGEPIVFFIDTAFTEKTTNDPTGIISTCKIGNGLYVTHAQKVNMKFPDLIRFIPEYVNTHGYTWQSFIRVEPKANGLSVIDQLHEATALNVTKTASPKEAKETRLNAASPFVESGRVTLVEGLWNNEFLEEMCGFPAKPHDEYVDLLIYAIDYCSEGDIFNMDNLKWA